MFIALMLLPLQALAQDDYNNPIFQCTEEELQEEAESCFGVQGDIWKFDYEEAESCFGELDQLKLPQSVCTDFPEGDCCSEKYEEKQSCWGDLIPARQAGVLASTTSAPAATTSKPQTVITPNNSKQY